MSPAGGSVAEEITVEKAALVGLPKSMEELRARVSEVMGPIVQKIGAKLGLPPEAK